MEFTLIPPAVGPLLGDTPVTVGVGTLYTNPLLSVLASPFEFWTMMSALPAMWAGETARICVELLIVADNASLPPKVTVAPARKFEPVIVTEVPPAVEPEPGEMPVTTGKSQARYSR
jgi:hypothetical protein